jgi:hypothetical protein
MSKYNLTDIFEQYQIGSGWTNDFDFEGMLNAGLKTRAGDDIEKLKEIFEDFTDVNYHREAEHLSYAIDALENDEIFAAEGKISDFHAEIRKTMEGLDMDTSDDLGAFMASKMEENTEAVDLAIEASQEKAGIEVDESFKSLAKKLDKQKGIDKDEAAKIAGSIAAKKAAGAGKGPTAKQKKRMNEVRIEKEVANRIEGLMNIQLKKQFLDVFEDLWLDLIEEDPFYAEDVIAHLSNEMSKQISNRQAQGDRLAGMEESDTYVDEIGEGAMQPGEADLEAGVTGNMDAYTEEMGEDKMAPSVEALFRKIRSGLKKSDKNFQRMEIDMYIDSLMRDLDRGDFDGVEQYSMEDHEEDLFNMVADKQLQEHFGRFMKKYQ